MVYAAYAALLSLAESLGQFLTHDQDCIAPDQLSTASDPEEGVLARNKQQIQSLREKVVFLLTFLEDCPKEACHLERKIDFAATVSKRIIMTKVVAEYGTHCCQWKRFCQEFEEATKRIDYVLEKVMQIKASISEKESSGLLDPKGNDPQLRSHRVPKSSHSTAGYFSSLNEKGIVVGLKKDLMEIKGRLCGEPAKLEVIPIVGMGGIGKTTLARYVFCDPLTIDHFDIRIWLTISQNFNLSRILLSLRRSINVFNKDQYESMDDESMVQNVYKYLKRRRYLLVMDDMWDTEVWDDVRRIFPDDLNGSRIIVTTRELDVASYVDCSSRHHMMHLLDPDQSWALLREKVFGQESCPPELEKIGKLIAENCRGLPLAIVVVAGILSKANQMKDTWISIAENVVRAVNTSDGQPSEILSLSYTHLPLHLRPCFLYMGGFPEDHEISVSKLVKLWVAEGFVKSNGSKDSEEVGEDYLEDLAKRSLVLINKKRWDGKIMAVKLHDLLRDLCLRKSRDEKFLDVINEVSPSLPEGTEMSHRLSVLSRILGGFPNIDGSHIRTLLLFHHWDFDSWKVFRLLRVVDAMSVTFKWYPYGIEYLCDLRYLAVTFEAHSKSLEEEVPESLPTLQNLQTLIIKPLDSFKRGKSITTYMPFGIWRMPQLRHLVLLDCFLPDPSTKSCLEISILKNLQTLTRIIDFTCSKRILEVIPNLKKLGIVYSYAGLYESGWSKYDLNNLVHLCKLEKLSLCAEPYPCLKNDVSQNLAFPMTLKRLTLSGCRFPWKDMTLVGSLPNLEVLKLKRHACHGIEWETIEGEFCQLKALLIDSSDLHGWMSESSHFPRLERLVLYNCCNLSELPYGIGEIPTLQLIEVDFRNSSIVESAERFKEEQQSYGNDIQVRLLKSRGWEA